MTDWYRHVYLSPHYDDAALSCGGLIHQQAQAGELVLVLTLCAAPPDPDDPLSPYAAAMHRAWGAAGNVVAARQAEDQAAMQILGADYLRLNFTDCIYRGQPHTGEWYYTSDEDIFGKVHPAEIGLATSMANAVVEMAPAGDSTTLYAPLGVGHHVDHQLAHAAAWQLRGRGYRVLFYQDYPYADPAFANRYPHTLEVTLAKRQAVNLQPRLYPLAEADLAAKIAAIRCYGSQLPILFNSHTNVEGYIRNYARHVGKGQPAARLWQ